jgi:hypothetical protein
MEKKMKSKFLVLILSLIFVAFSVATFAQESVDFGSDFSFFASTTAQPVTADNPDQDGNYTFYVTFSLDAAATESVHLEEGAEAATTSFELAAGASKTFSLDYGEYVSVISSTTAVQVDVKSVNVVYTGNVESEISFSGELTTVSVSGANGFDIVISHEDATETKELWVLEGGNAATGTGILLVGRESTTIRLADAEYFTIFASESIDIKITVQDRTYDADTEIGLGDSEVLEVSPDVRNVISNAESGEFDVVVSFSLDEDATASVFLSKNASATTSLGELAPGASVSFTLGNNDYVSAISATTTMDVEIRGIQVNILDETDIEAAYSDETLKIVASNASGLRFSVVNEDATATKEVWLRAGATASVGTGTAVAGDEHLSFRVADAGYVSVCASEAVSFSIKALDLDYNLNSFSDGVCVLTATEEFTKLTNNSTDSVLIKMPASGHESGFEGNFYFKLNATSGLSLEELVGNKAYSSRILMPNEYIAFSTGSDHQQVTLGLEEYGSTYSAALRSEMLGIANETAKTISFQNKQKKRVSLAVEGNGYVHFSIGGTATITSELKVASGTPASLFVPFGLDVSVVASEPVKFKLIATPISGSGDPGGRIESNYLLK